GKDPVTIAKTFKDKKLNQKNMVIFLGDGELYGECEKIAENEPSIRIIGRVENVREYLKAADYFVSSSLAEGLPNSVLEALSVGLPVCLSNISPHKEILDLNEKAGKVFNTKSIKSLKRSIELLIAEDYEIAANSARKIIAENLSASSMSKKYLSIYESELKVI